MLSGEPSRVKRTLKLLSDKRLPKSKDSSQMSRLRRKRIQKEDKVKRWKKTLEAQDAYKKVYDKWIVKRKAAAQQAKAV